MLSRLRALRIWPTSLAARTALVLLGGLLLSQVGGLMLHALDRAEMLHSAQEHELARRLMSTYRSLVLARPEQRANLIDQRDDALRRLREGIGHALGVALQLSKLYPQPRRYQPSPGDAARLGALGYAEDAVGGEGK